MANEENVKEQPMENDMLSTEDIELTNDLLGRVTMNNMVNAEVTIANQTEQDLNDSRTIVGINKTRAETLQTLNKTKLEAEEVKARIEKIHAETDLVIEEKKQAKWKIWAPVLGSAGTVALLWVGEKVFNNVITGKAINFVKKL